MTIWPPFGQGFSRDLVIIVLLLLKPLWLLTVLPTFGILKMIRLRNDIGHFDIWQHCIRLSQSHKKGWFDPRPHLRSEKFLLKGDFTFQDKKCQKIESFQEFVIFQEFQTKKIDSQHPKALFFPKLFPNKKVTPLSLISS